MKKIWTIGHSTRSLKELFYLLKKNKIEALADVRSYPGSRRFPHFNKENLEKEAPLLKMEYHHLKNLGGRRKENPGSKNSAWRNSAFRGFADYMETKDFEEGIKSLTEIASVKATAVMCSEAVWWKCHRSMISDYLKAKGWKVLHILSEQKVEEHPYTQPAKVIQGELFYNDDE